MLKLLLPLLLTVATALPSIACQAPRVGRAAIVSQATIAKITYNGSTYVMAKAKASDSQSYTVVYREKEGSCYLSYADPGGDSTTMSDSLPRPVAIALATEHLRNSLKKKGRAVLQAKINKSVNISPEYKEAALKLGLSIPTTAKIFPWDPNPDKREEKLN